MALESRSAHLLVTEGRLTVPGRRTRRFVRFQIHPTLTSPIPFPYWIPMQSNPLANISLQQLKQAVTIREKIETLEKEFSRIFGGGSSTPKSASPRRKGKMSAAARARISAGMKARWAKRKGKNRVSRPTATKAKGRSPGAPLK